MHDIAVLASRETLFFLLITAMGIGPAAFLPPSFPRSVRVAFAPVLGLSVAVCLFTTIEWYIDGNQAQWIVIPIAVLSGALGIWRYKMVQSAPTSDGTDQCAKSPSQVWRPILQMLLVCVIVSLPAATMLASQHSVGPTAYEVYDSPGYVADADGAQVLSIGDADHAQPPVANLELEHWLNQVQTNNRLDISPVSAALNALIGLHSTETWAAYLLAVLAAGGLALYGAICMASGTKSFLAVIGAGLTGGAFSLQLLMDGSQAAIVGLALVVPLLVLIRENTHRPKTATFVVTALLLGGLTTVYPIFFLPVLVTATIYFVLFAGNQSHWQWRQWRQELLGGAAYIVGVFLLSSAFDLVAAIRNIPEWISLLGGSGGSASQPQYHLGFGVIASWLLQVRDFYTTAFGPQSPFFDVLPTLILPLCVLALVIFALRRLRATWIPLLFIGICVLTATKQAAVDSCAYCEDRSLLPVVPVALFILFTTLAVLMNSATLRQRCFGAMWIALYLSYAGLSFDNEQSRFTMGGYFLPDAVGNALTVLPQTNRPVELEGFGTVPFPTVLAEEGLPFEALLETVSSDVSFIADEPGSGITGSFGPANTMRGAPFQSNYEYVVTRLGAITTSRQVLFQNDGIALEKRAQPLDVTIKSGLNAAIDASENTGVAGWVNGPLQFIVTGQSKPREKVLLEFDLPSPSTPIAPNKTDHLVRNGAEVNVCLRVTKTAAGTTASLSGIPANIGVVLRSMSASYGTC